MNAIRGTPYLSRTTERSNSTKKIYSFLSDGCPWKPHSFNQLNGRRRVRRGLRTAFVADDVSKSCPTKKTPARGRGFQVFQVRERSVLRDHGAAAEVEAIDEFAANRVHPLLGIIGAAGTNVGVVEVVVLGLPIEVRGAGLGLPVQAGQEAQRIFVASTEEPALEGRTLSVADRSEVRREVRTGWCRSCCRSGLRCNRPRSRRAAAG